MVRQDQTTTAGSATGYPYDATLDAQTEFETICDAVCARLRDGSLPPDEAYWWTRILFQEAVAILGVLALTSGRPMCTVEPGEEEPSGAQAA